MNDISSNPHPDEESQPSMDERYRVFWEELNVKFPTKAHAMQELLKTTLHPNNWKCKSCQSTDSAADPNNRKVTCNTCKTTQSLTAGTFFHNIRQPLAWLAAILLIESGLTPSVASFIKKAGVAYSTAWNIFRKLGLVIEEHMAEPVATVPSSFFAAAICRRSRETAARAHPISETLALEEELVDDDATITLSRADEPGASSPDATETALNQNGCTDVRRNDSAGANDPGVSSSEADRFAGDEKIVLALLSNEPVHFDVLLERAGIATSKLSAALTMLEFAGAVRCRSGDWYVRTSEEVRAHIAARQHRSTADGASDEIMQYVQARLEFLIDTFKGVACKYVQPYLAIFWCHADKVRWPHDSLLNACQRASPITENQVLAYVSPAFVRL